MDPSSFESTRTRLYAEQARLRGRAAKLARDSIPMSRVVGYRVVRDRVRDFESVLEDYVRLLESDVVPWLIDADAWGAVRVETVREEHAAIARMVAGLREELGAGNGACDLAKWIEPVLRSLGHTLSKTSAALEAANPANATLAVGDQMTG